MYSASRPTFLLSLGSMYIYICMFTFLFSKTTLYKYQYHAMAMECTPRPKRNLLLFPVTRPTRQKAADSVNFMALKKKKKKK